MRKSARPLLPKPGRAIAASSYRPSGRATERFAFSITAVERSLDPPRAMGYLVPGRGRRELRTDRILAVEPPEGSQDGQAPGRT